MQKVDLLIRNGRVIDPARNLDAIANVAVRQGEIVACEAEISAKKEIDASGCIVAPGLIDHHGHINYLGSDIGSPPDLTAIPGGVTAMADCGCTGVSNCRAFYDQLKNCLIKTKLYINVSPLGQSTKQFTEQIDPESWDYEQFETAFRYCGDDALGLKIRISNKIVGASGLKTLVAGLAYAERLGKHVLVHVPDPPVPQAEVVELLRPGDIFCHVYHQKGFTILENGSVSRAVLKARERGVLFDSAHGQNNFSWQVAEAAVSEGFFPDIISSDLTSKTFCSAPLYNMPYILTKFLLLGMDLRDVIRCVTVNPAKVMGLKGGTLAPGSCADIAILKLKDGHYSFPDSMGEIRNWDHLLVNQLTVLDGTVVYRNPEFFG